MKSKSEVHNTLKSMFRDVGVPNPLIVDGSRAQVQGIAKEVCDKVQYKVIELEKNIPASNHAKRYIQGLKNNTRKDMAKADSPLVFWDCCIEWRAIIERIIAKDNHDMSVISSVMTECGTVKFCKPDESYPFPSEWLGRCLWPAINKGNAMSQTVLTENGEVITAQTCRNLLPSEISSPSKLKKQIKKNKYIWKCYGDSRRTPKNWVKQWRKPGDPDQYKDPEDHNPAEEPYSDDVNGKAHTLPEADSIPD